MGGIGRDQRRSADAAVKGNEPDEAYHAIDYMVYAYLQLARDGDARRTMEEAIKVTGLTPRFVAPYAMAAMPARYALERGAWREAASLEPPAEQVSRSSRRSRTSRARSAPRAAATSPRRSKDAAQLAALHKALQDAKNTYWATEVEVQRLAAAGWIALAAGQRGRGAQAHARGRRPRGQEREAHRHARPRRAGARAARRHAAGAEAAGRGAQGVRGVAGARAEPLPRLLYGAAHAAEAGRRPRRRRRAIYGKLLALAKNADTPRPELARAKQ